MKILLLLKRVAGITIAAATLAALAACKSAPAAETASDAAQAETEFAAAADRAPTARTLYAMARIFAAQRRDAECEAMLSKIIATYPGYAPAYNDLAELLLRQRQIARAQAVLDQGLRQNSRNPILLNNLGMCAMLNHRFDEALERFTEAAGMAPDDARFRSNAASALGMLGRYEEAEALYLQILTPADAHYNLGVLAEARGDKERAAQEYALFRAGIRGIPLDSRPRVAAE